MSLGKRSDGLLFLLGHLKVVKSLRMPFNVFDIVNSKLGYINALAGWDFLDTVQKRVGLQMRRSSPFTSDGSIPLLLTESEDLLRLSSGPNTTQLIPRGSGGLALSGSLMLGLA